MIESKGGTLRDSNGNAIGQVRDNILSIHENSTVGLEAILTTYTSVFRQAANDAFLPFNLMMAMGEPWSTQLEIAMRNLSKTTGKSYSTLMNYAIDQAYKARSEGRS